MNGSAHLSHRATGSTSIEGDAMGIATVTGQRHRVVRPDISTGELTATIPIFREGRYTPMTEAMSRFLSLTLSRIALGAIFVISAGLQAAYTPRRLPPLDEAAKDPSFRAFRDELLEAVRHRNAETVLKAIDPNLRRQWGGRLTARDLEDMERPLSMGGVLTTTRGAHHGQREFCAPYAYSTFPPLGELPEDLQEVLGDGEPWVVVGSSVAVRSRPSIVARVIARLNYDLVPVHDVDRPDESGAAYVWEIVHLSDGREGWVAASLLWSRGRDYHACFAQVQGQWLMVVFNKGDLNFSP